MKKIFKIVEHDGTRADNSIFRKEWYCATNSLAEKFKSEKEAALPVGSMHSYHIVPIDVMDSEDDFYIKELR